MAQAAPQILPVIPKPAHVERGAGAFTFTSAVHIVADAPNRRNASYLQRLLTNAFGHPPEITAAPPNDRPYVHLHQTEAQSALGTEGYRLTVTPEAITVSAPRSTGVFYGVQTLRLLSPVTLERPGESVETWTVPALTIEDAPHFSWRGYMLDEGRHFHGMETVKEILEMMALHKLNVLHWHLTEDQGWRIEIQQYPRLTEVGGQRASTALGFFGRQETGEPHGGFYTQDEIQEIVDYAAARQITIVPEIEMPGHSKAALAAYPEFSCTGGPFEVATRFGIHKDVYCPGKERTFIFLQNILDEVIDLFPGEFIHLGGDEAPKARWTACPDCQRRIQEERLSGEHELQVYFTNRMVDYLAQHGRRAVGWNEILQPDLNESAVVQYWIRGRKDVIAAARRGRDIINSAYLETYLDHSYSLTSLRRAYAFDPVFPQLENEAVDHILGLEPPLWTEWVPTRARLDYQTFPRLTAYAETGWTPQAAKDYAEFERRLQTLLPRLDARGVGYASLDESNPPWYKRLFGLFTILQPQTKTARR